MFARAAALTQAIPVPRAMAPGARRLGVLALALVLLGGGFLWLRDSSLVAVRRVSITGTSGPQAASVREALETAGLDQSTLHVDQQALRAAVARFAIVDDVRADADFPRGLNITVTQHTVVATLDGVPLAGDGDVLRGARARGIPQLGLRGGPVALTTRKGQALTALATAAPGALRGKLQRLYLGPNGLTAKLAAGPAVYFGGSDRLAAKWAATAAVLASPSSQGATYIDVRAPDRPAAGGLEQAAEQEPAAPAAQGAPSTTP